MSNLGNTETTLVVEMMRQQGVELSPMAKLIGSRVTIYCANYIYTGVVDDVSIDDVTLSEPAIVYQTGSHDNATHDDEQRLLADRWCIRFDAIESYGVLNDS